MKLILVIAAVIALISVSMALEVSDSIPSINSINTPEGTIYVDQWFPGRSDDGTYWKFQSGDETIGFVQEFESNSPSYSMNMSQVYGIQYIINGTYTEVGYQGPTYIHNVSYPVLVYTKANHTIIHALSPKNVVRIDVPKADNVQAFLDTIGAVPYDGEYPPYLDIIVKEIPYVPGAIQVIPDESGYHLANYVGAENYGQHLDKNVVYYGPVVYGDPRLNRYNEFGFENKTVAGLVAESGTAYSESYWKGDKILLKSGLYGKLTQPDSTGNQSLFYYRYDRGVEVIAKQQYMQWVLDNMVVVNQFDAGYDEAVYVG